MAETKKAAFKRLAQKRTNNLIKSIRLVGNLSNTNNYSYTEEEFKHIFNTVEQELKLAKSKFLVSLSRRKKFKI
jgi:mitochondrial fission protein ELM1